MNQECRVNVRFHQPPEALRRYFTTFYSTDLEVPAGQRVVDYLHPEWAGLRFITGTLPEGEIAGRSSRWDISSCMIL